MDICDVDRIVLKHYQEKNIAEESRRKLDFVVEKYAEEIPMWEALDIVGDGDYTAMILNDIRNGNFYVARDKTHELCRIASEYYFSGDSMIVEEYLERLKESS